MLYASADIRWFTTPQELRDIADEMEKRHAELRLGDDLTVRTIQATRGHSKLAILIAQEKMP